MKKRISLIISYLLIAFGGFAQTVYTPTQANDMPWYIRPDRVNGVASPYNFINPKHLTGNYAKPITSNYTTTGEANIACGNSASITITLGQTAEAVNGKSIMIYDATGTASATKTITIRSHNPSTLKIDGLDEYIISKPKGSVIVFYDGSTYKTLSFGERGSLNGKVLLVSGGTLTGFESMTYAMAVATSGDVIVLQDDITATAGLTIPSGVSINGNGKNYTITGSDAVDAFYITGGTTKIFNFKKIESTRTGSAAGWLFACFGADSKMYVDADELKVADGCIALAGNTGSKLTINARKIDLGSYDASAGLNARKFLATNGAWIRLSGASVTDNKDISTAIGFVGSVLRNGSVLSNTADTLRSVLEFDNVEFDVSRPIGLVERMGELRMNKVKAKTLAKTAISMAGDPYVSGASSQNHYNKAIFRDCEFLGGTESQGVYFTSLISLTADNSQGFDTNFQDVYWYGTNYLNTNTTNSIYNSIPRYTMKNYGTLIYNGPISGETFTYNQPIPLGATLVGGGSVTSVGVSVPTGFGVTGSPVTGAGTIAITTSLSGVLKGTGSGIAAATAGTDYVAGGTGTTNNLAKFTASGTIGNSIASDDGSKMTVAGAVDAFLVTSTGSGVTSELRQSSNNDVLHRFKRNGGNYWDARYYYTGEAFKFNYNDTPVLTLNTSGAATLAGGLDGSGIFRALSGSYISAATGKGVEISYDSGGDYGQLLSYDRTGSTFKPFYFNSSQTRFQINSTTKGLFNADGLIVGGTTTNSGDVLTISNSGASQVEIGQFTSTLARTFFFNRSTGLYITNQVNALDHRFHIGGTEKVRITSTGDLSVYNITASTSTTTGSAIFGGGIGVGGTLSANIGKFFSETGNIVIYNTAGTQQCGRISRETTTAGIDITADLGLLYLSTGSSASHIDLLTNNSNTDIRLRPNRYVLVGGSTAIGTQKFQTIGSGLFTGNLSVNGLTAGATTDTTVVVNAGVFKKVLNNVSVTGTYSGTITWDGTAPSGTLTKTYGYTQTGRKVDGWIRIKYTTGGATNTNVRFTLSQFPTPIIPSGVGSSEIAYACTGYLATSAAGTPVASRAWLYESSGSLVAKIQAASNGYEFAIITFSYTTN